MKKNADLTEEMKNFFYDRTERHINLVRKYAEKIYNSFLGKYGGLLSQVGDHDASKYEDPEYTPYVYITWDYKCKDDEVDFSVPDDIKKDMNKATLHHVTTNRHHPEYHVKDKSMDMINREDRDKPPKEIIDASRMNDVDIAEMVSDWCAMSEEKGTSPFDWANKNIGFRWEFTDKQRDLIYSLLTEVWDD